MTDEAKFFDGWSTAKKVSLIGGVLLIALGVGAFGWWTLREPKAVLFADLAERDAAVLVGELDKLKQPYQLGEDGRSILVDAGVVHHTRMTLMGKQLPLHGAVGFELFNQADFGVSDFVQKVNYQRALQGELTRTILAIDQVQDARVHLALPEQTLFRKDGAKAKASVSVSLKGGQSLQAAQVAGIQRLIAASVPDIKADDVTVLDQHGVVLSRAGGDDSGLAAGQLDARQGIEAHLTRKAGRLLEQMFQPGEALLAVDVVLNHEQSRVTTEEVLPARGLSGEQHPAGVLSRERTTSKEVQGESSNTAQQLLTQENDYQNGRRTEQTVSQGGQIARLQVAVVVKRRLDEAETARLRQLLGAAVGLQPARGDSVVVHAMAELAAAAQTPLEPQAQASVDTTKAASSQQARSPRQAADVLPALSALALLAVLAVAGLTLWLWRRQSTAVQPKRLSAAEREALLRSLRQWLEPGTRTS